MRRSAVAISGALVLSISTFAKTSFWAPPVVSAPDTLEVRLFLVDFAPDPSSSPQTTGKGTFGSDTGSYTLERPSDRQVPAAHAARVLEAVRNYWLNASGGKLVIDPKVYGDVIRLGQPMSFFSLPARESGENKTNYWGRTTVRLLELVDSAVNRAATVPNGAFSDPMPTSGKRKVVFACMHAGVNRSTDGGTKGSASANSQRDLLDFYVTPSDFRSLSSVNGLKRDSAGIPVQVAGRPDTVRSLMLISEAMSQDGLNWGVAGLLAQQVGTHLGLPMTGESGVRDPSPGVLGSWDLMDAASSNGKGFLPSLPMAWHRLFLGWSTPVLLKPGTAGKTIRNIPAFRTPVFDPLTHKVLQPGQDTVFVIQLDGGEYLLLENRQRSDSAGWARLRTLLPGQGDSLRSIAFRPDSLGSLFEAKLSQGAANPRQPSGYIQAWTPDAGLPGSGILVWKVNEWLLQEFLKSQTSNPWLGDSLQDHYRGITLLQASGKPTLGQRFKNAAGETLLDYGTGADVLPHIRKKASGAQDTVTAIPAVGYVSTQTSTGARTLITLASSWPKTTGLERSSIPLDGDSVLNTTNQDLVLEIQWGALRAPQDSLYPLATPPGIGNWSVVPARNGAFWLLDSTGHIQRFDSAGRNDSTVIAQARRTDTLLQQSNWSDSILSPFANAAQSQRLRKLAVQDLNPAKQRPIGSAGSGDTLLVTTRSQLLRLQPTASGLAVDSFRVRAATPALLATGGTLAMDSAGRLLRLKPGASRLDTALLLKLSGPAQSLCLSRTPNGQDLLFALDSSGQVFRISLDPDSSRLLGTTHMVPTTGERFQLASSDFDRDGWNDVFVLGSFGNASLLSGKDGSLLPGWPRTYPRGKDGIGDDGAPALADIDGSGYPQILFTGQSRLWKIDRTGVPASGWPVRLGDNDGINTSTASRRFPSDVIGSSPLVVKLDGQSSSQVLVGSPDGRVFALTSSGSPYVGTALTTTAGSGSRWNYSVSSWPLAAGARTSDSTVAPWLHLFAQDNRLQTLSALGGLDLFHTASKVLWGQPGGSAARGFFLDASTLGSPAVLPDLSNFHFYPNPVRGGRATVRYDLGQNARSVQLDIFDQTSYVVLHRNDLPTASGRQSQLLEGLTLGSGVYAARLVVDLPSGSRTAWFRIAVSR